MTIIKVPTDVATSPQNGSQIRFDTESQLLFDEVGNSWPLGEPVGNKQWHVAVKWTKENYPED